MPSGPRTTTRPGAGPGRAKSRPRSTGRAGGTARTSPTEPTVPLSVEPVTEAARRPSLTARAIALAVVLLILTISYASSLRVYFAQAHEIAATKAEIAERQAQIAALQSDVSRWNSSAFVRAQARERLGWVMPGEIGFQVVGRDGKPLGGGAAISGEGAPRQAQAPQAWWDKVWGSVEAADSPAPAEPEADPAKDKPITTKTKPR